MKRSRNILFDRSGDCARGIAAGVLFGIALLAAAAPAASAQTITGLGNTPWGGSCRPLAVSADGSTVVGRSGNSSNPQLGDRAFRWTAAGGAEDLGPAGAVQSEATGVNSDGSVVVVNARTDSYYRLPFRWTSTAGLQQLDLIPGVTVARALGVSGDGTVVVGSFSAPSAENGGAFRWTSVDGMQNLGALPGDAIAFASAVSADGSVITGQSQGGAHGSVFRWTAAGGMEDLGTPGALQFAFPAAISGDGNTIVGHASDEIPHPGPSHAMRWTRAVGMLELPGGAAAASAVSFDGTVVIGSGLVWDSRLGVISSVTSYLLSNGIDLTGWTSLGATGVSADRRTFVGTGSHSGRSEGWIATIPPRCPADFNHDALLNSQDFFDFLNAFFIGDGRADFYADGTLNSDDFFFFVAAFFAGCA